MYIGVIDTNARYLRVFLAVIALAVHLGALLTTGWYLVFYAHFFEQYAEILPMINAFLYSLAELCLLLLHRGMLLEMLQELQTMIDKREFKIIISYKTTFQNS